LAGRRVRQLLALRLDTGGSGGSNSSSSSSNTSGGLPSSSSASSSPSDPSGPLPSGEERGGSGSAGAASAGGAGGGGGVSCWRPLSRSVLLCQAFASQVIAGQWLRNGDDVIREVSYLLHYREFTDLDLLVTQLWMASEQPPVALYGTLAALGGGELLRTAGVPPPAAAPSASPRLPPSDSSSSDPTTAAAAALHALVCLLRERGVSGLGAEERLRGLLVQWLALRDWTYNHLVEQLPPDLQQHPQLEQVLSEVSSYRAASLSQARHYCLRRDAWHLFSPHFHHYTPHMRSKAWERALREGGPPPPPPPPAPAATVPSGAAGAGAGAGAADSSVVSSRGGGYPPHWQLRPPRHPLPASLAPLQRVLGTEG
ncbi:hypothetical protein Agub_g524, partial [Astrephomene gubernaculifera]